ncbi:MAG: flagellar motor switch protein FliG [Zetaproteobacteria bacterium CG2_30_46_52]|nr:MAG: flagellar motor switch protein FliG [Zetaproteobacteria bacterium CG2_30_46_52]
MRTDELTGEDKAAILLYCVGPEAATPIIQDLDHETLARISRKMSELGRIEPDLLKAVLEEYLSIHDSDDPLLYSSHKDVRALLQYAVSQEKANAIIDYIDKPRQFTIWEKLSRLSPTMILSYIEAEHPQTIALILGKIDTGVASQVISRLPEDVQMSVLMRMSKIETLPSDLVRDIEETLEKELAEATGSSGMSFDGMVSLVEILKTLDKDVSRPLLERIEQQDSELYSQVDKLLLIFEDLLALSSKDIQTLLKHISSDDLVKALKGAPDELAENFFGNMSKRAAEIMREDMQVMGPLKLVDVEEAQQRILQVVRKLDDDGTITLSADDMV